MRSHLRLAAIVGAAALSTTAVAPAVAAAPLAQSGANAITVSVAGNEQGSGNVTAKNDGSGEQKTGDSAPPISVLKGQELVNAGVLAQEASATVTDGAGSSAACAGITGNGGSVAQLGDSSCLDPGEPLDLSLANLDLKKFVVADPESALAPLNQVTDPVLTQVAPIVDQVVAQARQNFGEAGLRGGFGVLEASCAADGASARGTANLVDAGATLELPGQSVTLLKLPVHPKPNTHLTTDLSAVVDLILNAVRTDLEDSLEGAPAPLAGVLGQVQEPIVKAIHGDLEKNLAPLEQNVLDVVLNKQSRPTDDSIRVSALDLSLLPAARDQFDGAPLVGLQVGNVVCGPNGRSTVAAPAAPAPTALPTAVSAGVEHAPQGVAPAQDDHRNAIVLGAFAVLVVSGAGFVSYRRLRA